MKRNILILIALSGALMATLSVRAQGTDKHAGHHSTKLASTEAKPEMVDAEVKKVDKDAKKITLKHGEIKSLEMPAMTMAFQVKDAKLLDNVKSGDKVKVNIEQTRSGYVVTNLNIAK